MYFRLGFGKSIRWTCHCTAFVLARAQAGRRAEPLSLSSHLKSHLSCLCPTVFWGFRCTQEALCLCDATHNIYQTEYLIFRFFGFIPHPLMLMRGTHKWRSMKENIVLVKKKIFFQLWPHFLFFCDDLVDKFTSSVPF